MYGYWVNTQVAKSVVFCWCPQFILFLGLVTESLLIKMQSKIVHYLHTVTWKQLGEYF